MGIHEQGDEKSFLVVGKLMHVKYVTQDGALYFIFCPNGYIWDLRTLKIRHLLYIVLLWTWFLPGYNQAVVLWGLLTVISRKNQICKKQHEFYKNRFVLFIWISHHVGHRSSPVPLLLYLTRWKNLATCCTT